MPISLVTGGAGFLGAHLSRELLSLGHEVVVLDDLSGGFLENLPPDAEFVRGSVLDHALLAELFQRHRFDYVYHLAAYAAEGLSHFIRRFNYQNNVVGSMNVLNEAIRHRSKHFVFTSSIAVYGTGQPPLREDQPPSPEDPYGVAKLAVEQDLAAAHEMFGIDYTIFRPHNVYGEYQNIGDRYRNVIGIFMNQIMQGAEMTIFGDGLQTRAFSHVDDVAPVIAGCVDVPASANRVFNIGADRPYTVLELAQTVAHAFGVEPRITHLEARREVVHAFSSHERVVEAFGPQDYVPLEIGIERMAEWAQAHGARRTRPFAGVEVLKNMPPSWRSELTP
jgi:UDP-glucose 4-epimerase